MDKGFLQVRLISFVSGNLVAILIIMDKGFLLQTAKGLLSELNVAILIIMDKGFLQFLVALRNDTLMCRNPYYNG